MMDMQKYLLILYLLPSVLLAEIDPSKILADVSRAQREVKTISADFVQEKNSSFFSETKISSGHLYYRAPDAVLWEHHKPENFIILVDGNMITMYDPAQKKVERTNRLGLY